MIWIVFAVMVAAAVGVPLLPLLRPAARAAAARYEYDLTVYRDQLDEIGRDVERGLLSADQAEAARTEIQRRMLAAADNTGAAAAPVAGRKNWGIAAGIAVAVPLIALPFYGRLGAPELPDQPYAGRAAQLAQMRQQEASIQAMVSGLAQRLTKTPGDGRGWAMLGRSYRALGRFEEAKAAFEKAVALLPTEVGPKVEYATLLIDEAQGLVPEAVFVLRDVLAINPNQPEALFFVGQAEAMIGNTDKAKVLLTRLYNLLPPESPARAEVKEALDSLSQ